MRKRFKILWLATTSNIKTGPVPTAYIGTTVDEVRESCQGCPLLDCGCYAWAGLNRVAMHRHEEGYKENPERYLLSNVLKRVRKQARFARLGAMGDPAHADRRQLRADLHKLERAGLATISYTHFWRHKYAEDLRDVCMASCETAEEAEEALDMGWRPAMILPWDHHHSSGPRFYLSPQEDEVAQGLVCPAQTKEAVTCNSCQLCRVDHPAWSAGKIHAIGFLEHSRRSQNEARRLLPQGVLRQLPMFSPKPKPHPTPAPTHCQVCGGPLTQEVGHRRVNCSTTCKDRAEDRRRRGVPVADPVLDPN